MFASEENEVAFKRMRCSIKIHLLHGIIYFIM